MWLFLAFLAVPLIEIGLFIQVGGAIGLWPTLAIVVLTAILGTWLVRTQGLMAIGNLQQSFSNLQDPTEHLAHGAMILISGALLLTPGFFTDAVGFALLMPPVRSAIIHYIRKRISVQSFTMGGQAGGQQARRSHPGFGQSDVVEGEFHEVDPTKQPTPTPPGVTKH